MKREELLNLKVFACEAAKRSTYGPAQKTSEETDTQVKMVDAILQGKSLTLHQSEIDPIGSCIVAAVPLKSRFGAQIKHYVFQAHYLDADLVMAIQTLTEILTQSALSVKTLDTKLHSFTDYQNKIASRWLRYCPKQRPAEEEEEEEEAAAPEYTAMDKIKDDIDDNGVTKVLNRVFYPCNRPGILDSTEPGDKLKELITRFYLGSSADDDLPDRLEWLEHPYRLPGILDWMKSLKEELLLPLDDLRVRPFVSKILTDG